MSFDFKNDFGFKFLNSDPRGSGGHGGLEVWGSGGLGGLSRLDPMQGKQKSHPTKNGYNASRIGSDQFCNVIIVNKIFWNRKFGFENNLRTNIFYSRFQFSERCRFTSEASDVIMQPSKIMLTDDVS